METSLLIILGSCISFSALLYYFIFVKRESDLGWRGRAGIFSILFIITPIILIVLFSQSGAEDRLRKIGFEPHPNFSGSVGIAVGTGKNPIWVFSTDGDSNSILQFYKVHENHGDWSLLTESQNELVFEKEHQKMSIHIGDGNVVFSLMASEETESNHDAGG